MHGNDFLLSIEGTGKANSLEVGEWEWRMSLRFVISLSSASLGFLEDSLYIVSLSSAFSLVR